MPTWRYIAQRATTGEWLDWNVPLRRDELTWGLSGGDVLRGTLSRESVGHLAADGRSLLEEWGTLLYAEADGIIRWGGIVVRSRFEGAVWSVEAAGFSAYPHGIPYMADWGSHSVDPLDAVREIWRHLQARPDGDLGVVVDATTSPVRLGIPPTPAYKEVCINGAWVRKDSVDPATIIPAAKSELARRILADDGDLTLKNIDRFADLPRPFEVTIGSERLRVTARRGGLDLIVTRGVGGTKATAHSAGTKVVHAGTEERTVPRDPGEKYALAWFNAPDCGGEIDSLSKSTPFDYVESHAWKPQSDPLAVPEVDHRLMLGYPRLGTRRFDLSFVQGVNVVSVVPVERNGDEFGNEAFGIGAGDGRRTVRASVAERDGRLRRPVVFTDKAVTTPSSLTRLARLGLASRRSAAEVVEVEVEDHPDARLGSWALGDDVLVEASLPWLGDVAVWSRVVGWTLVSDTRAKLALRRSDAFTYGRAADG